MPSQHIAPTTATPAPTHRPPPQPNRWLITGVSIGASKPTPLPPVFMMAALIPACLPPLPPNSIAVTQNALSQRPRNPSAAVNQDTTQGVLTAPNPASKQAALASMLRSGRTNRFPLP